MFSACRFFQSPQGCYRGASCTFRHETQCPVPSSNMYLLNATNLYTRNFISTSSTPLRTCRYFRSGNGCRNGTNCPFVHVTTNEFSKMSVYHELQPPLPLDYSMGMSNSGPVFLNNHPRGLPPSRMRLTMDMKQDNRNKTTSSVASCIDSSTSRQKAPIQANGQEQETISEIFPVLTRDIEGPFFAVDVECVATGNGTNDRDVARIAVVDEDERVVFDQYVKPTKPIVSYLTQLTGITERNLVDAPALEEALVQLKEILPVESVIVGQSIKKDLKWLMLEKPTDYKGEFDVADLFRLPMQSTNGVVRYRYFSLRHVAKYLLGQSIQEADHDPVIDARYAMKVFKRFRYLHENPGQRDAVLQTLLKTPRTPSFAERYPVIDGVSMRAPWKQSPSSSTKTYQPSCC